MLLSIKESFKIDLMEGMTLKSLDEYIKSIEEGLEYLVFTDYHGEGDRMCSVAYATSEVLEGPSVLIDDSIRYIGLKINDNQTLESIFEFVDTLVQDKKINRAYLIDYIKKSESGLEFFISVE